MRSEPDQGHLVSTLEQSADLDTPNPPGREVEAARYISQHLQAMGCRTETIDILPGRTNVIGVFENGPGPVFAFNTHIDVVPAGEVREPGAS